MTNCSRVDDWTNVDVDVALQVPTDNRLFESVIRVNILTCVNILTSEFRFQFPFALLQLVDSFFWLDAAGGLQRVCTERVGMDMG